MPRKPRFYLSEVPAHVVQRGSRHRRVFLGVDDYLVYLDILREAASRYQCAVHAYVLMPGRVHILTTPARRDCIGRMMQYIGREYVTYFNRRYDHRGTLWEGRHKGCVVDPESYLLLCSRYIESVPVYEDLVADPGHYCWTSYRANALGERDAVVRRHEQHQHLADAVREPPEAYRRLFDHAIAPAERRRIEDTLQSGTPLGDEDFRRRIERTLNCKVGYERRGRPPKSAAAAPPPG